MIRVLTGLMWKKVGSWRFYTYIRNWSRDMKLIRFMYDRGADCKGTVAVLVDESGSIPPSARQKMKRTVGRLAAEFDAVCIEFDTEVRGVSGGNLRFASESGRGSMVDCVIPILAQIKPDTVVILSDGHLCGKLDNERIVFCDVVNPSRQILAIKSGVDISAQVDGK